MLYSTWQHGVFIGFYRWNHMWIDKHGQVMISTDINTIEYENNYTGLLNGYLHIYSILCEQ